MWFKFKDQLNRQLSRRGQSKDLEFNGSHNSHYNSLKNSVRKVKSKFDKGLEAEVRVKDYFLKRGGEFLGQRVSTPFAEVDLVFAMQGEIWFIEVKLSAEVDSWLISPSQAKRLFRVLKWQQELTHQPVRLHLAVVSHEGSIEIIEDVLCELIP